MSRHDGIPADKLIAHRGYQRHFPENSPLAIEKAIACGAVYVEIDVQFSADGIPLLYHDHQLKRISGVKGKISDHTLLQLKNITAGEAGRLGPQFIDTKIAPLTALADILLRHPAVQALVELKEEAVQDHGAAYCIAKIRDSLAPVIDRCLLISFDIDALRVAKAAGCTRLAPVLRDWALRHQIAHELDAEMVIYNYLRIPAKESLHMPDCRVAVYEVDSIPLAKSLLARGASLIETFAIGELIGQHADA